MWFNGNRGNNPPLLQGLKRCLSILGDTLKREGMGGGEHERKVNRYVWLFIKVDGASY